MATERDIKVTRWHWGIEDMQQEADGFFVKYSDYKKLVGEVRSLSEQIRQADKIIDGNSRHDGAHNNYEYTGGPFG